MFPIFTRIKKSQAQYVIKIELKILKICILKKNCLEYIGIGLVL